MSLDDGVAELVSSNYSSVYDRAAWHQTFAQLLQRTRSRFVVVSAVDFRNGEFHSSHVHGPDDARFLDGMRDYEAEFRKHDPSLQFGMRHPNAGFTSLRSSIENAGGDYRTHAFRRWTESEMGAGGAIVRYTPVIDGLTFSIALLPDAARAVHDEQEIRLFRMLFEHFEVALRSAARPAHFDGSDDARILIDARGRVCAVSPLAEQFLCEDDGLRIVDQHLCPSNPRDSLAVECGCSIGAGGACRWHGGWCRPRGTNVRLERLVPDRQSPAETGRAFRSGRTCRHDQDRGS